MQGDGKLLNPIMRANPSGTHRRPNVSASHTGTQSLGLLPLLRLTLFLPLFSSGWSVRLSGLLDARLSTSAGMRHRCGPKISSVAAVTVSYFAHRLQCHRITTQYKCAGRCQVDIHRVSWPTMSYRSHKMVPTAPVVPMIQARGQLGASMESPSSHSTLHHNCFFHRV